MRLPSPRLRGEVAMDTLRVSFCYSTLDAKRRALAKRRAGEGPGEWPRTHSAPHPPPGFEFCIAGLQVGKPGVDLSPQAGRGKRRQRCRMFFDRAQMCE